MRQCYCASHNVIYSARVTIRRSKYVRARARLSQWKPLYCVNSRDKITKCLRFENPCPTQTRIHTHTHTHIPFDPIIRFNGLDICSDLSDGSETKSIQWVSQNDGLFYFFYVYEFSTVRSRDRGKLDSVNAFVNALIGYTFHFFFVENNCLRIIGIHNGYVKRFSKKKMSFFRQTSGIFLIYRI